ncbi:alpha-tocopherol transfer protein [Caerostris darwini]|uniref:Alpha-tocopherol transfer protein n=1 Tax=Caerostris darwini TaxID=1538125 RepID=A0AAV4UR92_9ARAC|nr:alpha-tocopherol transfer protein [Caerostris darwini]
MLFIYYRQAFYPTYDTVKAVGERIIGLKEAGEGGSSASCSPHRRIDVKEEKETLEDNLRVNYKMFKMLSNESEEILPFEMDRIPEFVLRKCEVELTETPEKKLRAVQEVRELLRQNWETSDIDFHDDFIVQFLRRNKYDVRRSCKNIQNFVVLRKEQSEMFRNIEDEYFSSKSSTEFIRLLPKRCPEGCAITLFQLGKWDPNELAFVDVKRLMAMCFVQLLRDPMTQISGVKAIFDFQGTSFQHLRYVTLENLHLFYNSAFNCIPCRYKRAHIVNESLVLTPVWAILKQFLSEKIKSRVHFHSNMSDLFEFFPRSVLPAEYGGDLPDADAKDWLRRANMEHGSNSVGGQPNFY